MSVRPRQVKYKRNQDGASTGRAGTVKRRGDIKHEHSTDNRN